MAVKWMASQGSNGNDTSRRRSSRQALANKPESRLSRSQRTRERETEEEREGDGGEISKIPRYLRTERSSRMMALTSRTDKDVGFFQARFPPTNEVTAAGDRRLETLAGLCTAQWSSWKPESVPVERDDLTDFRILFCVRQMLR